MIDKPCDNCTVNLEQAFLYDEVTCFQTCKKWLVEEKAG